VDLELTEDQLELRDVARAVLADACPPALPRAVHDATRPDAVPAAGAEAAEARDRLWRTLCGLDWPGLGIAADHGGLGLGPVEVGVIVEELGRVVAPTPFLATATQLVPMVREAGSSLTLGEIAAGSVTGTLAVAEGGRWTLDAVAATATRGPDGWVLAGTKSHVLDGATAHEVAVVARSADGIGAFLVPGPTSGGSAVRAEPLAVMDPTLPLATVVLDGAVVGDDRVLVAPGDPRAEAVVERAVQEATAMLALSTVATCRAIFEATVAYAKDREQFGRPIGSFQAVKHRLADCYLAVERAHALAWFAVATVAEDDPRRAVATSMAKAAAGDCQRLLTCDGLQLHGGIGFTWEHDLHLLLKRALTGELLLGTSAHHRARLAVLLGLADEVDREPAA
jgi:alkylation response protein AidB-like acyl-CoA dehydrogenase